MDRKRGLAATVVPAGPNLVSTWRRIATQGGEIPLVDALNEMNTALGTQYRHHRVTAWEQALEGRKPKQDVINYMMSIVLPHLLEEIGVSERDSSRILKSVQIAEEGS